MQQTNDTRFKDKGRKKGSGSAAPVKRKQGTPKQVGDETANPLPDDTYSARQPSDDTTEANPQGGSPVD